MDKRIQQVTARPYCVGNRYFPTPEDAERYCRVIDRVHTFRTFGVPECYFVILTTLQDLKDYEIYNDEDYDFPTLPAAVLREKIIEVDDGIDHPYYQREVMGVDDAISKVRDYLETQVFKHIDAIKSMGGELSLKWGSV